jgi:amidase
MRYATALLLGSCLLACPATAQDNLSGHYTITLKTGGLEFYNTLELTQTGDALTGTFTSDPLTGTRHGDRIDFVSSDKEGNRAEAHLTLKGGVLSGSVLQTDDTSHHTVNLPMTVIARPAAPIVAAAQHHEFKPTAFHRAFSALTSPALTIAAGDTVHTTTIDAGGIDENAVGRSFGGNPQTGPFYVTGAMPGDTIAIHILKLRLNRDWATSDDYLVSRAVNPGLAVTMKDTGKTVYWHLDRDKNIATPEKPGAHLAKLAVPLRPMLGCVAVAPPPVAGAPNSGDSGGYGGNMDFNEITEGATVYLQARVPGALVYIGDGHAAMGDGELNGNALETSMDVTFRVEVIQKHPVPAPRVENAAQIMALGYDGSLDEALKTATANMQRWLASDYALDPSEASQVMGTAARIRISEAADRNAGVAVILDKSVLATLTKDTAK